MKAKDFFTELNYAKLKNVRESMASIERNTKGKIKLSLHFSVKKGLYSVISVKGVAESGAERILAHSLKLKSGDSIYNALSTIGKQLEMVSNAFILWQLSLL